MTLAVHVTTFLAVLLAGCSSVASDNSWMRSVRENVNPEAEPYYRGLVEKHLPPGTSRARVERFFAQYEISYLFDDTFIHGYTASVRDVAKKLRNWNASQDIIIHVYMGKTDDVVTKTRVTSAITARGM